MSAHRAPQVIKANTIQSRVEQTVPLVQAVHSVPRVTLAHKAPTVIRVPRVYKADTIPSKVHKVQLVARDVLVPRVLRVIRVHQVFRISLARMMRKYSSRVRR